MAHRPASFAKQLARTAVVTVAMLVAFYFFLTSSVFLKAFVVPRLAHALNARVQIDSLSLSPFSSLQLRQVRVETWGTNPVFQAQEVRLRYRLLSLMRGKIYIPEITLVAPKIDVIEEAGRTNNLAPLLYGRVDAVENSPRKARPRTLSLGRVILSKATARYERHHQDGSVQSTEITGLDFALTNLANGASGCLTVNAALTQAQTRRGSDAGSGDRLDARLNATVDYSLMENLWPSTVHGNARIEVTGAHGAFRELAGLTGQLVSDVTPTEVREVSLRFEKNRQRLGTIRLTGPLDVVKEEARLKLEIAELDRNVLNFLGAPMGLDFLNTSLSASSLVDLSRRGEVLASNGRLNVQSLAVRKGELATSPLDLALDYQLTVNWPDRSAVVHRFSLTGAQAGRPLLTATLDRPMNLAWGQEIHGLNDSSIAIRLTDLRCEDWRLLLGTNLPSGTWAASATIACLEDGKRFNAECSVSGRQIRGSVGKLHIRDGSIQGRGRLAFQDYRSLHVEEYSISATESGVPLASAAGSASFDVESMDARLQLAGESDLAGVFHEYPVPDLALASGKLSLDGLLTRDRSERRASLNLGLKQVNGEYRAFRFKEYEARLSADAEVSEKHLTLRRITLATRQGIHPAGSVDIGGQYDRSLETGEFSLNVDSLSDSGLRPVLAPFLAPCELASVTVRGLGTIRINPRVGSVANLQLAFEHLHVVDPARRLPNGPLDFYLAVTAAYQTNEATHQITLDPLVIGLPPTSRGRNELVVDGTVDLRRRDVVGRIRGTAVDMGPILDAFQTNRPAAAATAGKAGAEAKRRAWNLPIDQLAVDLAIDRLYAREVFLTNWVSSFRITRTNAVLDPLQFNMNGGPVSSTLRVDLSGPELGYDVRLRARQVPLEPIFRSASPGPIAGVRGNLDAEIQLQDSGRVGSGLHRGLSSTFNLGSTNLSLLPSAVGNPVLATVLGAITRIPDLAADPKSGLGGLLSSQPGTSTASNRGWIDEFKKTPIEVLRGRGKIAGDRVELEEAVMRSAAFKAESQGTIVLAPAITNSTLQLPVQIALSRSLLERAGLAWPGGSTTESYGGVPDVFTVKGTWGKPELEIGPRPPQAPAAAGP